mmetsp:Transcript_14846/g.22841  ORF Transcript_14846/g.22841 Transcript_14846/m.22841 type:complete len:284 (+) Transcript_14846:2-853(+)
MCRRSKIPSSMPIEKGEVSTISNEAATPKASSSSSSRPRIPLYVALLLIPFLPSDWYINRGYTQWFHGVAILQLVTNNQFVAKFCALQGLTVCCGWYACMACDYVWHGRFGHLLYRNMPTALMSYMIEEYTSETHNIILKHDDYLLSYGAMGVAHLLDFLGHPILCWYFWKKSASYYSCDNNKNKTNNAVAVLTWPIIITTYLFSRLWSITQSYVNYGGSWQFHYFGTHVYDIPHNSLHLWYPAYIAEAVCYVVIISWKLVFPTNTQQNQVYSIRYADTTKTA